MVVYCYVDWDARRARAAGTSKCWARVTSSSSQERTGVRAICGAIERRTHKHVFNFEDDKMPKMDSGFALKADLQETTERACILVLNVGGSLWH
jgi:hypothetical protein